VPDRVYINGIGFSTLVAVTAAEQERGLMGIKWPPPVMCFPYKRAEVRKFWMKNTISPLDIVFCNDHRVVGIYRGEPLSNAMIGPEQPSDLVVELPAGTVEEHGIRVGQPVSVNYSADTTARLIRWS
jgi:uncharacterized membrane protein (UPF0127 family)